ncbi:MAG TPA: (d)CMP kinase [Clostridia bacterium]|nr:(d)CMP kinase [Clostridia bacterium]
MQITIDGPAGAGKSTIAKMLADKLGFLYIDTGAMYRAITYTALQQRISLDNEIVLAKLTATTTIEMVQQTNGEQKIYCNGVDVTKAIREPFISKNVSQVAAHPQVRQELVRMQRELAQEHDVVMDGRDAGTVILPHANCKIFLTASLEERAHRRYLELKKRGHNKDFALVKADLAKRDYIDENRAASPLIPAQDAVIVDTTCLNPTEVVQKIFHIYQQKKETVNNVL